MLASCIGSYHIYIYIHTLYTIYIYMYHSIANIKRSLRLLCLRRILMLEESCPDSQLQWCYIPPRLNNGLIIPPVNSQRQPLCGSLLCFPMAGSDGLHQLKTVATILWWCRISQPCRRPLCPAIISHRNTIYSMSFPLENHYYLYLIESKLHI